MVIYKYWMAARCPQRVRSFTNATILETIFRACISIITMSRWVPLCLLREPMEGLMVELAASLTQLHILGSMVLYYTQGHRNIGLPVNTWYLQPGMVSYRAQEFTSKGLGQQRFGLIQYTIRLFLSQIPMSQAFSKISDKNLGMDTLSFPAFFHSNTKLMSSLPVLVSYMYNLMAPGLRLSRYQCAPTATSTSAT